MKAKLFAVIATFATFSGCPSQGFADTVTFYDTQASFNIASNTSLLDNFSFPGGGGQIGGHGVGSITRNGVTYTDASGGQPDLDLVILAPGYNGIFGANVGTTTNFIVTTDYDEHIRATFSSTYTAVGFTAYFNGLGPGTLTVFGIGGTTLGALAFPSSGIDPATGLADQGYLGFTSTAPITGFQWDTTDGGILDTGFSNLSVGAVPEPSTWAMLLIGFVGLGFMAYRRKRNGIALAAV